MSFGGSVIVFRSSETTGAPNDLGEFATVITDTPAPGCRHRPMSTSEMVEMKFDVSTRLWKSTLPLFEYDDDLVELISFFPPTDAIVVDGVSYQIVGGVRPYPDRWGNPYKATIISQIQSG
jgi:hypothetical protein